MNLDIEEMTYVAITVTLRSLCVPAGVLPVQGQEGRTATTLIIYLACHLYYCH